MPSVFIDGRFVGGCDDGVDASSPGLAPLAESGQLEELLLAGGRADGRR